MLKKIAFALLILSFSACSVKKPVYSNSVLVVFKTPTLKFYDKGFITKYDDYIQLQVFEIGHIVLDLKVYKNEVCQGILKCISTKEFNEKYLSSSYDDDFLYKLLDKKKIYFKDKVNHILIKIKK